MWCDIGKLIIAGKTFEYHYEIDSPAGPWRIILIFPDGSTLLLEWGSKDVDTTPMENECELAGKTTKSESCEIFCVIKKMLESCADDKIYRDTDF
jgi:hypothetical protein